MTIPDDLKIFSYIYEYRFFALVPLYALWIAGGFYFLFRLKKVFFSLAFDFSACPFTVAYRICLQWLALQNGTLRPVRQIAARLA